MVVAENIIDSDVVYKDGTYTGTGTGYGGTVTLSVTISNGQIANIEAVNHSETSNYWNRAISLFSTIVTAQNTEVDSVSGATRSSNAIKTAVNDALVQAASAANDDDDSVVFSSGSGTEKNPYVIKTASQLANFATSVDEGAAYEGQYIVLGADIDLSGYESWNPIGAEAKSDDNLAYIFNGTFDGQGYTISNMTINVDAVTENNVGLFSTLNTSAVVKNVNMTGVDITLNNNGTDSSNSQCRAGSIAGNSVNAARNGNGDYTGVIGAQIDSCQAAGTISIKSESAILTWGGGIIGRAMIATAVTNCYSDVDITAESLGGSNSAYAGGIVGTTGNYAIIANCASFGNAYASSPKSANFGGMAGGVVGMLAGKMYNVASSGNVTIGNGNSKYQWGGAIAGEITSSGMEKQTDGSYEYYSTGAYRDYGYYATDSTLTEEIYSSGELSSSNAISPVLPVGIPRAGATGTISTYDKVYKTTGQTMAEMATQSFVDTLNGNIKDSLELLAAYGTESLELREWELVDGKAVPTGSIWVSSDIDAGIFQSGSGTEDDPYIISTADQLDAFAASLNEKIDYKDVHIALGNSIAVNSGDWKPIGGSDWAFNGTFDGKGYTISGISEGSVQSPLKLDSENLFIGLFGVLGKNAVVKNVNLTDVAIYTSFNASAYIGGIAGYMEGDKSNYTGALIDSCFVSGVISHTAEAGNQFVGGLVGHQYKGAIINSWTDADLSGTVASGDLAEVGGLVGLNNRGLVANCYSFSNIYGSGNRDNGNEGMAVVSTLVAVQAGNLVNCYAAGDITTKEYSTYAGMVSGWVTGIGKSYACWYDLDSTMIIAEDTSAKQVVDPVESIGTKVSSGVNDEGDAYTGGLVDGMTSYDSASYANIAQGLNNTFSAFPVDIASLYGLSANALKAWVYEDSSAVTFGDSYGTVNYVQPDCEIIEAAEAKLQDGTWYGRSDDESTVVKITVENGEITATEVISGSSSGDSYDAALATAQQKSIYGDFSHYYEADITKFSGGSGTEEDPYLISTVDQLSYLSYSVNSDVDWSGVYFKQTADIDLSGIDWQPIGWALNAEVN